MRPRARTATLALAGALLLVYAGTVARGQHSGSLQIDPLDLTMLGAASGQLVAEGEIWRLATAPFLHFSPQHLLTNLAAILVIGFGFEQRAGSAWLLLACLVGGLSGTLFSVASNPALSISVGASGSVCALLTINLVALAREPRPWRRLSETLLTGFLLLLALVPVQEQAGPDGITDLAAHLGGSVAGLSLGFAMWQCWPRTERSPRRPALITGMVAAGLSAVALCHAVGAWRAEDYRERYAAYAARPALIAAAASPSALDRLISAYPRDPRPRIGRAGYDLQEGAYASARRRLRAALDEPALIRDLGPGIALKATILLSYASLLDGDAAEARRVAGPVCPFATLDRTLVDIHRDLIAKDICPAQEGHRP